MKTPTRFVSPLTAEERENLITAFKTHSSHPVRVRAHAVLLSERRFTIDEIAEIFDVHRNTVTEWLDRWEEDRSVDDHPGRGRKPTFDDEEQKEVVKLLDEQPQSSKRVLAQIEKKTGKTISRDTLRRIAKKHRRRWKRVRRSLRKKRDEADFQAAKAELEALEAAAEQTGEFQVCYGDEAGFALGKIITSAWQPIGETIEIAATNEDDPQINVFGIYNRQNQFYSTMFEGSLTSEIVIACLDDYSLRITLPTLLAIDGASIHTSKDFKARLEVWEERGLFIYILPAYSPELNLIEILWRMIKYHWITISAYQSYKLFVKYLTEILSQVGSKYQINFAD